MREVHCQASDTQLYCLSPLQHLAYCCLLDWDFSPSPPFQLILPCPWTQPPLYSVTSQTSACLVTSVQSPFLLSFSSIHWLRAVDLMLPLTTGMTTPTT